ncbi:unnamed protein product [Ixodes persulcatus]
MAVAAKKLAALASLPDAVVFLLVQAGLVCQWAYDYEHYARGNLTVADMYSLVAVQQLCMLLGPWLSALVQPLRLAKPLVIVALVSAEVSCLAKIWGFYWTASVVQGLFLSALVACLNPAAQPAALDLWQNYACQIAWTAAAVAVDLFRFSLAMVYGMAACAYLQAAILVARKLSPPQHLAPSRRAESGWSLEARLKSLAAHIEDMALMARAVSDVCIDAVAILTRAAFPGLVLESCASLLDSPGMLFVVRLCVERAGSRHGLWASQSGCWGVTSWGLPSRMLGYALAVVGMAIYFGTASSALDVCTSHFLVAYAVALAAASEPPVPPWHTTAGGLLSAGLLLWGCGGDASFDAALGWSSVLLCVGLLSTLAGALAQVGGYLRWRVRTLRNCFTSWATIRFSRLWAPVHD